MPCITGRAVAVKPTLERFVQTRSPMLRGMKSTQDFHATSHPEIGATFSDENWDNTFDNWDNTYWDNTP